MSKYNKFAKNLDAAFKTARDEYAAAYAKYEQAERAAMDAQHRAPDDTAISYELRKAKAEAARVEQKAAFDEVCKRVGRNSVQTLKRLLPPIASLTPPHWITTRSI